ncbi:MAG: Glycoprotease [Candidatus Gottesmanbacteria bacterium GW2011_GWA2_41_12]|uniref:Glycoprotease n=2 Tax=Candidatus Gottesmaniibacteriota TaxID=1752720 RepID=A0A0G0UIJ3_9BACT|nr:MAG: Glycoprotease [Candidatus Gottesmanbacteria bacterium GW2011_GWC2_39_8]KKR88609.1 MAG: Glycoprotease [Candidatus Gottesmanbacteria bacterium GW2011_GWA2_41_12]
MTDKEKNILIIDTSNLKETRVGLSQEDKVIEDKEQSKDMKSQVLLPVIFEFLKKNKVDIKNITGIEVVTKGDSFTGLRVGFAVANIMALILGIKVNGKKPGETEPEYFFHGHSFGVLTTLKK